MSGNAVGGGAIESDNRWWDVERVAVHTPALPTRITNRQHGEVTCIFVWNRIPPPPHFPPSHFGPFTRSNPAARLPHPLPTLAKNSLLPLRMKYRLLQSFSQLLCFVNHPVIICTRERACIRAGHGQSARKGWPNRSEEPLAF